MLRKICAMGGMLALLPALVLAADGQVEAARQCAQQKDSLQRLVCYDRIFQADAVMPSAAAGPAAVAPGAAAPAAAAMAVAPAAAVAAPAAATAPKVAAAPAAPVVAAAPAAPPALGDESLKKKKPAEPAPKSLEARVTAVRESRPELFRVTLENGQIWQQMETSSLFHLKNGDVVRIEKGAMGSYRMSLAKGSGWVRVTRVE